MIKKLKYYAHQTIDIRPPLFYIYWSEDALKKQLKIEGFDLEKTITRVEDPIEGLYWEQIQKI